MNFRTIDRKVEKTNNPIKSYGNKTVSINNQYVVLTGKLPGMTRAQAENFIFRHGGHVSQNISSKTTLLINGNPSNKITQKLKSAQNRNIQVITPSQIAELHK